ncbi:hypothetical protein MADRUGA_103 [Mycobacterium phage Madruga]|uniref:Uncharacterized protein n=1 Tax=Mycobacterium phage Madruga TaxID=1675552 RepID=A0A0K1LS63_9CAUD|nr:hypothetical protein MADRUGA_103 [Mycobacterium phage Madruga]
MNAAELARQVAEAEALVRQLERGQKVTPKQSQPVLNNSHGGYAGKSLIQKIRDDLRETIGEREEKRIRNSDQSDTESEYLDGLIDGMCHALGILRQNEGDVERRWAEAEYRQTLKNEQDVTSEGKNENE